MSLYDAVKDAANIARKADNIELYQKIMDLQAQALDEQEAKSKMSQRIRELEEEVRTLRGELAFAKSVSYDPRSQTYHIDGEGSNPGAHICSRCWDTKRVAVRLRDWNGYWGCPECSSSVDISKNAW